MVPIEIAGRTVGGGAPPLVVAELSGNHRGSLERALELVDAAAEAGADAVKLQTYTADTMTLDHPGGDFQISDPDSIWDGERLYELYSRASTPWEWHETIFERAASKGLVAFSSAFDSSAVDFLEQLDVPCYKVSSFECTDIPLIEKVCSTGKPVILSTGMATAQEIEAAVRTARAASCDDLVLLKCTSDYPAPPSGANLRTIPDMGRRWSCPVGVSDHSLGIGVSIAAVALGAVLIEKHLTLSRDDGAVDSEFSMTPAEFALLAQGARHAWEALGEVTYGPSESEVHSLRYRRSLYFTRSLAPGEVVSEDSVKSIRPSLGLAPKYQQVVVGSRVTRHVSRGERVEWDAINRSNPVGHPQEAEVGESSQAGDSMSG